MFDLRNALLISIAGFMGGCAVNSVEKAGGVSTASTYALQEQEIRGFESKAEAGSADAALRLWLYYNFSAYDDAKRLVYLRRAAELGNAHAQFNLAVELTDNPAVRDLDQAESWLAKADKGGQVGDEDFPDLVSPLRKRIDELRRQAQGK